MMLSILAPYDGEDDLVRWSGAAQEGNDGSKAQIAWLILQSTHLWERTKLFWARRVPAVRMEKTEPEWCPCPTCFECTHPEGSDCANQGDGRCRCR